MTTGSPSPTRPTSCAVQYCACGRCYSPGSLVGDWIRRHTVGVLRAVQRVVLRRPHPYEYEAGGGVRVPAWVVELLEE